MSWSWPTRRRRRGRGDEPGAPGRAREARDADRGRRSHRYSAADGAGGRPAACGGVPRDQARRVLVTAGAGRLIIARGQTTARGGCPPGTAPRRCDRLRGSGGGENPVWRCTRTCGPPHAAPRSGARGGFPRVEVRCRRSSPAAGLFWQRFVALAEVADGPRAAGVRCGRWRRHGLSRGRSVYALVRAVRAAGAGRSGARLRAGVAAAGRAARRSPVAHPGAADARDARGIRSHDAAAALMDGTGQPSSGGVPSWRPRGGGSSG